MAEFKYIGMTDVAHPYLIGTTGECSIKDEELYANYKGFMHSNKIHIDTCTDSSCPVCSKAVKLQNAIVEYRPNSKENDELNVFRVFVKNLEKTAGRI